MELIYRENDIMLAVQSLDPRRLQIHPLNAQLYGMEDNTALQESIATHGILTPLQITRDLVIISGHRRHAVALALGLSSVPVMLSLLIDPREIEEAIIRANIARDKTNYQLAREYQKMKPIQAELAKQRQRQAAGRTNAQLGRQQSAVTLPANLPEASARGEARELAARMLGMKCRSAEKALQVLHAIDRAQQAGYPREAELIIAGLNQTITRGYRIATALGFLTEQPLQTQLTPLTGVPWARWKWNPFTGCRGECADCPAHEYAKTAPADYLDTSASLAQQKYWRKQPFAPRLHLRRLPAPLETELPHGDERALVRVLTCWQGDLFGPGVDLEARERVLEMIHTSATRQLPWRFLLRTCHPSRLLEVDWPNNVWLGVSISRQQQVDEAEVALRELRRQHKERITYLLYNPRVELLHFSSLAMCSWLYLGQLPVLSPGEDAGELPTWENIDTLRRQAAGDNCRLILSGNLRNLHRVFPDEW